MENPVKIKKNSTQLYIIIGLIVSNVAFGGLFLSQNIQKNRAEDSLANYKVLYAEAYQDYQDALNDVSTTEDELAEVLLDLATAENQLFYAQLNLNSSNTELEELYMIQDNTRLSGTFYLSTQYNMNHNLGATIYNDQISYASYFFYRNELEHPSFTTASSYSEAAQILAGYCRSESVSDIAVYINNSLSGEPDEKIINALLTFVQDRGDDELCIHYVLDGTDDFAKYPIETLCEGCGDCEDKSILFASLAHALGYDVRIAATEGHVMVYIHLDSAPTQTSGWHAEIDGKDYYFCETTGYGNLVGDLHVDYQTATWVSAPVL